ncbi:MAG: hypothetical protein A2Z25_13310 [Planctomycetes bacterium RBG_16_55_9]|nr:MAG: hypothetical protein A2Z25_13310 [Planctomycetes bacterium RBG_16_55_9]
MILSIFNSQYSIVNFLKTVTAEHLVGAAGLLLLARWLLTTSLGRKALADSPLRSNNMPPYAPLIPLFIWFGPVPLASMLIQESVKMGGRNLQPWQAAFLDNCVFCIGAAATVAVIVVLARTYFDHRLKGFGLDPKTIARDFAAAVVNLLAVWPLVMAAMILTVFLMTLISKQEYQMERHQELNLIIEYPQLSLRILILFVAVLVAPVLEEMLFRGLFQTSIRSVLENSKFEARNPKQIRNSNAPMTETLAQSGESRFEFLDFEHSILFRISNFVLSAFGAAGPAWLAIVISSGFFALMHANAGHWPALFVLGIGMGYAYEKSGSLFRSIFIHALFNGATVAATLSQ